MNDRLDRWTFCLILILLCNGGLGACSSFPTTIQYKIADTVYFADSVGIWKHQLNSNNSAMLTEHGLLGIDYLSLSPDNKWLAFAGVENGANGNQAERLWIIGMSGGDPILVTGAPILSNISWVKNELVFDEEDKTYIFEPVSNERTPYVENRSSIGCYSSFHPTRKELRLDSCPPTDKSRGILRVFDVQTNQPVTITEPFKNNDTPQWANDGNKILFSDGTGEYQKVFIWDFQSQQLRQILGDITQEDYLFVDVSWSPDKEWIAFGGLNDLCLAKVATGAIQCHPGFVSSVGHGIAWSPNSDAVVISSNRIGQSNFGDSEPQWDLFTIRVADGEIHRITDNQGREQIPIWGY